MHPREPQRVHIAQTRALAAGVSESRFWGMFVQCIACKSVTFRQESSHHECNAKTEPSAAPNRRHHPYSSPPRRPRGVRAKLGRLFGDSPELPILTSLRPSPVPTQRDETEYDQDSEDEDDTEVIPASDEVEAPGSDDFELPSILQILDSAPHTSRASQ